MSSDNRVDHRIVHCVSYHRHLPQCPSPQVCGEEGMLAHLGNVLYECMGEEYPEVSCYAWFMSN